MTMSKPRVYFARPVVHSKRQGDDVLKAVRGKFDEFEWVNPLGSMGYDYEDVLVYAEQFHEEPPEPKHAGVAVSDEEVVKNDKSLLEGSDGLLLALTKHRSVGVWREVEYAKEQLGIPVAIWWQPNGSKVMPKDLELSAWLTEAGYISASANDCVEYLKEEMNYE